MIIVKWHIEQFNAFVQYFYEEDGDSIADVHMFSGFASQVVFHNTVRGGA